MLIGLAALCFASLWLKNRQIFFVAFCLFLLAGFYTGSIQVLGLIILLLSAALFYFYSKRDRFPLVFLFSLLVLGLLLGLHVLPGFSNLNYANGILLSDNSAEFDIWFNYDKLSFGLLGMAILLRGELIQNLQEFITALKSSAILIVVGIASVYSLAVAIGYSQLDLTLDSIFWP